MFGKKIVKEKEVPAAPEVADIEVPIEEPQTIGMPGFVEDNVPVKAKAPVAAPVEAPAPVAATVEAPAPVAAPVEAPAPVAAPAEQYQIVETAVSPAEGLYVYKIIINKYLGELGGVYNA